MENYYQVKFDDNGIIRYGIVDNYSDNAKHNAKLGIAVVEDAVMPQTRGVPFDKLVKVSFDEYDKFITAKFDEALAASNALNGLVVGRLFGVPVADGMAWYVITKVNKTSVKIEWRGFAPDRWVDQRFGYGGSFMKRMVDHYVGIADFWTNQKDSVSA